MIRKRYRLIERAASGSVTGISYFRTRRQLEAAVAKANRSAEIWGKKTTVSTGPIRPIEW